MAVTPLKQRIPIDMGLLEILNHKFEQLATDPVVMTNGRVWYNTTDHRAKRIENGVVVPFFSAADALKLASYEASISDAQAAADAAQDEIDLITSDNILSKYEKSVIKSQYDLLLAEQSGIDIVAAEYGITTEKTAYDNAITALTNYITGLDPSYTDYTQDTVINGALFRSLFGDVYLTRQLLSNAMSNYAHDTLDEALSIANNAKTVADQASIDAGNAMVIVEGASNDGILSTSEKPAVVQQFNIIQGEFTGILDQADSYGIITERGDYYDAVNLLSVYIESLIPTIFDYTQSTVIVRIDFNEAFQHYFYCKELLLNAIYAKAKLLADTAAIIANSKGKHFIVEPTTPYYVGDLYSNAVDLYRCIVQRLTGAYNAADWEVATHYDRTKTVIDGGLVTTGRIEVGGGVLGATNAGMNGSVSGAPTTDIRFWSGDTYANRATAPWRVQNDGTFYATKGVVGGWTIDTDAIYRGVKKITDGFAANAGDITLAANGSIHAKNFYINSDGEVSFAVTDPTIDGVKTATIDIGDWDMDTDDTKNVVHGLTFSKIRSVHVFIRSDSGMDLKMEINHMLAGNIGGSVYINSTTVVMERFAGAVFDSATFNATSYNRGWITIEYEL